MSNQLLPCPFCGGEARFVPADYVDEHGDPLPFAECDSCVTGAPVNSWNRRATQPAAGEPVAREIVECLPVRLSPGNGYDAAWCSGFNEGVNQSRENIERLYATAPPATAPMAAGEPVGWIIDWPEEPELGHYFGDSPAGADSRSRPLYVAPPAAAHEGEAVRKDAERYRALRNTPEIFIGVAEGDDMVFLKSPDQLDQLADNAAAMRAQAGEGGA